MRKKIMIYSLFFLLILTSCGTRELVSDESAPPPERYPTQGIIHFMYGEIYRSGGNYNYANLEYKRALEYDTTVTILNAIGESYRLLGKHQLAKDYFENSLRLDPDDPTAQYHITDLYMKESRFDEAIPILKRRLENEPESMDILQRLAECYRGSKQFSSALEILDRMIAITPEDPWPYIYGAEIMLQSGHLERAAPYLEQIVPHIPPNNDLYEFWVRSLFERKDISGMLEALELWLQSKPEILAPYLLYIDYQFQMDEFEKAEEALSRIRPRWHEDSRISYFMGVAAMARNEADSVWYYFEQADAFRDGSIDLYLYYGLWFWEQGALDTAEKIADRAIAVLGPESRWLHMKAMIRAQKDDLDTAEKLLLHVLRIAPENLNAQEDLANVYVEMDRPDEADSLYAALKEIAPDNHAILNNYAYALARLGLRLDDAMAMVNSALKHSKNAAYYDTKAWILYRQGKYNKSLKFINNALDYPDAGADVHYHHGRALQALRRTGEAKKAFQRALEIDPDNSQTINALEELE